MDGGCTAFGYTGAEMASATRIRCASGENGGYYAASANIADDVRAARLVFAVADLHGAHTPTGKKQQRTNKKKQAWNGQRRWDWIGHYGEERE